MSDFRPWSMQEMIDNSDNWTLAGDVALLNTLKSLAENIVNKTSRINNNLSDLTNKLNEASLQLGISQNKFHSLRNAQFIESRVYEDDETIQQPINKIDNKKSSEVSEHEKLLDIKSAIDSGLDVIDKHFDKVQVSISDSSEEDEVDFATYVLRPKDPYVNRPLPFVIGSEDWHKKWHVGLEDSSSSDSESEEEPQFSDSDQDLPKNPSQDTSSELDFSNKTESTRPVANSTFNDSVKHQDISVSSDENSVTTMPNSGSFADELAAKLGKVIDEKVPEFEINKRPIQKVPTRAIDLFSDEPPPIDQDDDGLFSGGSNLFDDKTDDLDDFWGAKSPQNKNPINKIDAVIPQSSQKFGGLFDDEEKSDEDDIFASVAKNTNREPFLRPYKPAVPIFDEEPPELEEQTQIKKKPAGGVSIFGSIEEKIDCSEPNDQEPPELNEEIKKKPTGGVSLFGATDLKIADVLRKRRESSSTSSEQSEKVDNSRKFDNFEKSVFETDNAKKIEVKSESVIKSEVKLESAKKSEVKTEPVKINEVKSDKEKKLSLFDDDTFEDDLFSGGNSKKFTSNLFDDEIDPPKLTESEKLSIKVDLFDPTPPPDDDWEAKSDSIDQFSELSNQRSSWFDIEPPSLDINESSGIVRDQIASMRSQTNDDSSFYPYASSSRRLSSEIFAEQQYNDSLFVTKNKSESQNNLPSIPESTNKSGDSVVDLTPSGNSEHLYEESTKRNDLFQDSGLVKKIQQDLKINVDALSPERSARKLPKKVDDSFDNCDILVSVTKDRAKLPINRRPSTRRGRQEALKKSSTDFKLIDPPEDRKIEVKSDFDSQVTVVVMAEKSEVKSANLSKIVKIKEKSDNLEDKNDLFADLFEVDKKSEVISDDWDDLFAQSQKILGTKSKQTGENKNESISKTVEKSEVKSISSELVSAKNIFDDEDEEMDDIFGGKHINSNKKIKSGGGKFKKSLFGDEDDEDDDIFGSTSTSNSSKIGKTESFGEKKSMKIVRKLENTEPIDDPLSDLFS